MKINELKNSSIELKIKERENYYNEQKNIFEKEENEYKIKILELKKEEENINKNLEEKRNKIIEYNKIIKGQENLKKEINNNLIFKKKYESIK